MKVRDVMSPSDVRSIGPRWHRCRDRRRPPFRRDADCVVDDAGRLLGIVTEADLVATTSAGRVDVSWSRRRLFRSTAMGRRSAGPAELMTAAPDSVAPDDGLVEAARRMLERHHKRLPVLVDGRVVGIVSRHDLLRSFGRHPAG